MNKFVLGASLTALVGAAASADVTYSFTNQTWAGFNFSEAFAAGSLSGSLTSASINAVLDASVNYTYADDLTVWVTGDPTVSGGALQMGGYSDLSAAEHHYWPNGGSSAPGTTSIGTVSFTAINFAGDASDYGVFIGNGYGYSATSGTFTGSITLHGVNAVPAPGALALVGLAGLVGRRRR
ncbi:MAG: hypothetical protein O2800_04635 [Planctomycetota bacterium]|nr:hypothetical protein [Planctomycetota bacterium]